jgi:hypothetical protein
MNNHYRIQELQIKQLKYCQSRLSKLCKLKSTAVVKFATEPNTDAPLLSRSSLYSVEQCREVQTWFEMGQYTRFPIVIFCYLMSEGLDTVYLDFSLLKRSEF